MNGSSGFDLDQVGEVGLVLGRVDERVLVVVEQPEELVEAHVDARRLDHLEVERVEADAPADEFGPDVAVGEQHAPSLPKPALVVLRVPLSRGWPRSVVQWQNSSFPSW